MGLKPDILKDWRRAVKEIESMQPRMCATCFCNDGGRCAEYDMDIPKDHLYAVDQCELWHSDLDPF